MKMVDLKLPKKTKEEKEKEMSPIEAERDRWPYGMQLRFESEQCEKMPNLKEMKIGAKVDVAGIGEITCIRMNEKKGGKEDYSVEIQMQQIGVEGKNKSQESMIDAMKNHRKNMTMKVGS